MKAPFVVLLIALLSASAIFATVTFGEAQVVTSADIVLSPLSATIHVDEAVAFTVTVPKIIETTAYCQWFLDGVKVRNQNYPTWTFVPTTTGNFSVSVFVGWYNTSISAGPDSSYINGTAGNAGSGEAGFMSQSANVLVTTSSPTGSFGYPYTTMSGGGFGDKYVARGSRFALNVKANVTSITALLSAFGRETPSSGQFTYAIYNDENGSVGALVAQTSMGQLPDMTNLNWFWETLVFPSPIPLDPGFYWLMEVDNGNGNGSVSMGDDIIANVTSVYAHIGSMTFPDNLESPVYQQIYAKNLALDIFASYNYDSNAPPANLTTNPAPNPTDNDTHQQTNTTVNLTSAPSEEQNDFSVKSNSTLSAFVFDSINKQLSFTVSGPQGTTGFVDVSISKSIIDDISNLQVKLDDQQIAYSSESQPDYWLITFNYNHSTHTVNMDLASATSVPSISPFAIYAVVITAIAVAALLVARTKIRSNHKHKT